MKKQFVKRLFSLVMAGVMTASVFTGGMAQSTITVQAEGYVSDAACTDKGTEAPAKDAVVPNANQYKYQKDELAAFVHFGPNTFNEIEWGEHYGDRHPSEIFTLTEDFDARTLVESIKDAGFKKLIITAKHHDGFCIWPSAYTDYDAEEAGYEGDILAEISAWCTKYNIDMGLYLSPWDINAPSYGYYDANGNATNEANDALDYNEYYINQLQEILGDDKYGNNGKFVEVWMDGAKGSGANAQEYDFAGWIDTIYENEGEECMLIGAESYSTVFWIGNEWGYANEETWSKIKVDKSTNFMDRNHASGTHYSLGWEDGNQWAVPECDARITSGWFWGNNKKTPKTIKELAEMYFRSVGHNGTLLLNIPPNNQGTVDQAILDRMEEFGNAIKDTFSTNKAANATVTASEVRGNDSAYKPGNVLDGNDVTYWTVNDGTTTGTLLVDLGATTTFDVVSIEEAIQFGQRITSFKVEYRNGDSDTWKTFQEGTTIGSKRLCRQNPVKADELRITVSTESEVNANPAVPMITEVGVYKAEGGFELGSSLPDGMELIDNTDTDVSDGAGFTNLSGWVQETGNQYTNGTNMYANPGGSLTIKFNGTKIYLVGTKAPNHGKMNVSIDGGAAESINTNVESRAVGQIIYESGDLAAGEHTLTLSVTEQAIGIEAAYVINNSGAGMIGIESDAYTMNEDSTINVKLVRAGGTTGEATVLLSPNAGTAIQDDFNTEAIHRVTFAAGETEKEVAVQTRRNTNRTGDRYFTVELSAETEGVMLGFNTKAKITILDAEYSVETVQALITECNTLKKGHYTAASWAELQECLSEATEKIAQTDVSRKDIQRAYDDLAEAKTALVARTAFTAEDPFVFPAVMEQSELVEAEFFALDYSGAAAGKEVRIEEKNWDDTAIKAVDWFEPGNKINLPYVAEYAGTYTVTMKYRSGRVEGQNTANAVNWSGENIVSGSLDVYGEDGATTTHTATFEVAITTPGEGVLTFTADSKASPVIDYFEIQPKAFNHKEYTITATAGEHGTITPAGETVISEVESQEYTITPEAGFVIADVLVNGESVGAVDTYTVTKPTADVTISATFAFGYYTEANPYQIPAKLNETVTLEAEHFILENTGENEQWVLGVNDGTWASNGKFVNCINANDKIKLYYNAPVVGRYSVTLTYRSGSNSNSFTLEEANGKIIGGSVTAGNGDASVTKTKTFDLVVTEAGAGLITLTGGSAGAAQMDKFEITLVSDHEHTYSESWTAGEEGHWKACTHTECEVCGGCDAKKEMSAHTYNWTVEKAATCTEEGTEVGTCSVCYIVTTRTTEANGHNYAEVWSKDGQNHWKECTVENCDAVSEKAEHTYGEWTVKTAATCAKAGEEVRICSVCGAEETRAIEKLATHVSGTEWLKDTNNHWHVCTVEGCTEKTDVAAHTWDAGVETKKPTATVAGEKTYTCTVCKETKKEAVPATGTQDGATKPSVSLPKKNAKVKVNGVTYKVTKPAKKGGTVSFAKPKTGATNVTIPATITIKGVKYNVTAIEKDAFNKNKKVKTITVGTNVTTIGATAFNNCAKLKKITFKTTKLNKSKLAKTAFKGIKKSTRIVVNKKKVNAYKTMFRSKGLGKTVKVTK